MTVHRIAYEVLDTVAGTRYRATCRCGEARTRRSPGDLASWGPEHVVSAWEREHAAA